MLAQAQPLTLIDGLAIVLSVVSLIVTVVGFFASLKFYRDGVELQRSANTALTKLEEKTQFIQTQVGGMFDKTLDAAIGKREALSETFEGITGQLEEAKSKIIEEAIKQIGTIGEQERAHLAALVDGQMELIRERIETTRASVEEIAEEIGHGDSLPRRLLNYSKILSPLADAKEGLTLQEIVKRSGISRSRLYYRLQMLLAWGYIENRDGRYYNISGERNVSGKREIREGNG